MYLTQLCYNCGLIKLFRTPPCPHQHHPLFSDVALIANALLLTSRQPCSILLHSSAEMGAFSIPPADSLEMYHYPSYNLLWLNNRLLLRKDSVWEWLTRNTELNICTHILKISLTFNNQLLLETLSIPFLKKKRSSSNYDNAAIVPIHQLMCRKDLHTDILSSLAKH